MSSYSSSVNCSNAPSVRWGNISSHTTKKKKNWLGSAHLSRDFCSVLLPLMSRGRSKKVSSFSFENATSTHCVLLFRVGTNIEHKNITIETQKGVRTTNYLKNASGIYLSLHKQQLLTTLDKHVLGQTLEHPLWSRSRRASINWPLSHMIDNGTLRVSLSFHTSY